jgi:hypothetical protein
MNADQERQNLPRRHGDNLGPPKSRVIAVIGTQKLTADERGENAD